VVGFTDTDGNLALDPASVSTVGFVTPNTSAAQMGLIKGDKILAMNGIALPENTGSKESALAYLTAARQELTKIGFGAPITLKVLRDGKEIELKGTTPDQLEGQYYVQEKTIDHSMLRNAVIMFDLRTPTGRPIALGSEAPHGTSPAKGTIATGT